MTKREKVISALEICKWQYEDYDGYWPDDDYKKPSGKYPHDYEKVCWKCPYLKGEKEFKGYDACLKELHQDALELLKEREPVKPIDEMCWYHTNGRCGHCRAPLPALEGLHSKFCWMCGKAVKWDADISR